MRKTFAVISLIVVAFILLLTTSHAAAEQVTCPNTPPTRLAVGMNGQSTDTLDTVRVRAAPSGNGKVLASLTSGQKFTVVGGPKCVAGFVWWQIKTDKNVTGWSAEGDNSGYFIQPLASSSAGTATADETAQVATPAASMFGKNGSKIAFMRQVFLDPKDLNKVGHTIYVMNADGSDAKALTKPEDNAQNPAWSPDGKRISYWQPGVGYFAMNADGSNPTQLMAVTAQINYPKVAWSPDGQKIAFGLDTGVLITNTVGNPLQVPFESPTQDVALPSWSPDSQWLMVLKLREAQSISYEIRVIDVSESVFKGIPNPAAQPDGSLPINPPIVSDQLPSWSPDSKHVIYAISDQKPYYEQLVLSSLNLSAPFTVLFAGNANFEVAGGGTASKFSPDGTHIGFTTCVHSSTDMELHLCSSGDVFVVNADGTKPINLSKNGVARVKRPNGSYSFYGYDYGMSWSPDSQFVTYDDGISIYVADIGGRSARDIGQGVDPQWQP